MEAYVPGSLLGAIATSANATLDVKVSEALPAIEKRQSEDALASKKRKERNDQLSAARAESKRSKKSSTESGDEEEKEEDQAEKTEKEAGKEAAGKREGRKGKLGKEEPPREDSPEKLERTIFIGNVPVGAERTLTAVKQALKKKFSEYGAIESLRMRSMGLNSLKMPAGADFKEVKKVAAAKNSLDERVSSCNAYIVYTAPDAAKKAAELANGCELFDHHLRVDLMRANGKGGKVFERGRTIFVGNLAYESTEEELRRHVEKTLGPTEASDPRKAASETEVAKPATWVESVRIVRDPRTSMGKGFGYVLLHDRDSAIQAVDLISGSKIRERELRAELCEAYHKTKTVFKGPEHRAKFFMGKRAAPGDKLSRKDAKPASKGSSKPHGKGSKPGKPFKPNHAVSKKPSKPSASKASAKKKN